MDLKVFVPSTFHHFWKTKNLKGHGFISFIRMCYFEPSSYWLNGKCKCIMARFLNFLVLKIQGALNPPLLVKNSLI
jgi:hypothetical protein